MNTDCVGFAAIRGEIWDAELCYKLYILWSQSWAVILGPSQEQLLIKVWN